MSINVYLYTSLILCSAKLYTEETTEREHFLACSRVLGRYFLNETRSLLSFHVHIELH